MTVLEPVDMHAKVLICVDTVVWMRYFAGLP